jgi:hypothetical protein
MPDSIREQLGIKRDVLLKSIQAAASSGNSTTLLRLSEEFRQTEFLLGQHDSWVADAEIFLSAPSSRHGDEPTPQREPVRSRSEPARRASGRDMGGEIRSSFLRRAALAGLKLSPYRGAIYRSASGVRIGIAVATERQQNRWFLGLKHGEFDAAVLLCQSTSGRTADICLPPAFVKSHRFSQSGGQDKFNVARREGHLFLTIPGLSPVPVDRFSGGVAGLGAA